METAPVRSSGIESRPLESRPLGAPAPGAPVAGTAPGAPAPAVAAGALRTTPKGFKRPYTDATLGEMKVGEGAPIAAATGAPGAGAPTPAAAGTTVATAPGTATVKPDAGAATPAAPADAQKGGGGPDLAWPAKGKVVQTFAEPKHMGIVLDGNVGDPVGAAADGRVIFSGPGPRGYGNLVIVKHDADTVTVYAHNKSLLVKEGQSVKRGQKIAEVGDTGAEKAGLHFEVRKQGKPVDPQKLLPKR